MMWPWICPRCAKSNTFDVSHLVCDDETCSADSHSSNDRCESCKALVRFVRHRGRERVEYAVIDELN